MKKPIRSVSLVFVVLMVLLSGCTASPMATSTSTLVPPTLTSTPSPRPPTFTPEPTETLVPIPNPFVGYWTQPKLSEHPLGMAICGNFQTVEFFEDGTFVVTNDYSGVYKDWDFGLGASTASGKYTVLDGQRIEIKYAEDNVTEWEYLFSDNALTMSSPAPADFGGGLIPCYFSKSNK